MSCRWSTDSSPRSLAMLAVLVLAVALPSPLLAAAPRSKVVVALISAAQKEFDAGHFDRAGELFADVWKQDKTQTAALYNAARAMHMAAKVDKAEELYRELLALQDLDGAVVAKVKGFLTDLQARRGDDRAEEAARAEKDNNYTLAAQLWTDASRLSPGKHAWLLRQARAEHLAGRREAAGRGYDRYLADAPADAPGRAEAGRWQAELRPATAAAPLATANSPATVHASTPASRPTLGYVTLGAGVIGIVAGGALLGMAAADDAALQAKFTENKDGLVSDIGYKDATQEAARIEGRYQVGWVLTGLGAVAAAAGTWLVATHETARVTVAPRWQGAVVAVHF